jgi:putative phosphoribosyl transferase
MFKNRKEAGRLLAKKLTAHKDNREALILAIPRGGVVVAFEVAAQIHVPLDVIVVKKIGTPDNEELAAGAAGMDSYILNEAVVEACRISREYIRETVRAKQMQIRQRYELLRGSRPFYSVTGKTVIVIDDGLATGATMSMALRIVNQGRPKKVICAVPVAPPDAIQRLQTLIDQVVCVLQPWSFQAIGEFYKDFRQVEDDEARRLLKDAEKFVSG